MQILKIQFQANFTKRVSIFCHIWEGGRDTVFWHDLSGIGNKFSETCSGNLGTIERSGYNNTSINALDLCISCINKPFPDSKGSWGQHRAQLGPTGPSWGPCWPHELCYLGLFTQKDNGHLEDIRWWVKRNCWTNRLSPAQQIMSSFVSMP